MESGMATVLESNKTKIAKRVIEVFEFFDESNAKATVMDIVRRYGRPQSSTSELLASLVEMGLLYKDARSRSYSPTPRLATLGSSAQPSIIRDGRLFAFMDRLSFQTRCSVALFGMVGTHVQIFRWSAGADPLTNDLGCGASEQLSSSTAGLLLLSTLGADQAGRMLWRLNAEAASAHKFNPNEYGERVAAFRRQGHATGHSGFIAGAQVTATLLPRGADERPLALGLIYANNAAIDSDALVSTLTRGVAQCAAPEDGPFANVPLTPLMMAV
jgi:DNA-binding IclR family transcriptional regulator